jgi:hypothetical protein
MVAKGIEIQHKDIENLFRENTSENFPNLGKGVYIQIQES